MLLLLLFERGWRRQGANKKGACLVSTLVLPRIERAQQARSLLSSNNDNNNCRGKKTYIRFEKKKREKEDHDDWRITALPNTVDPSGQCGAAAFVPPFFSWGAAPLGDRHRTTDTKTWADTCRSIRAL
ncbi:hypothetical protein TW95_gp0452 [Pandoravirus inopinatum]|uniref:Uncharacterized protein n=1 Tax=Pandoravirus inopinatum TaxID=1605721 RepID=A0A0B5J8T7_9VIRU|nr:hypothetical protein TW95_gp0452 [Pandoravirus inopinatum]AJF97186.1 hypothetical protein [Pandoravirus inopinatum]